MSAAGCRLPQTAGRRGSPKIRQRLASSSWMQRTPAGLPCGMPGIGEEIEGAMQQAPHPLRQEEAVMIWKPIKKQSLLTLYHGGKLLPSYACMAGWPAARRKPGLFLQ